MKDSLKYPGFWQKKRNELRIDDDPQSDWLQMQALLDQQMPSANTNIGSGESSGFKELSLWAKLGIILLAAAVIYSAYYFWSDGKHKHAGTNKFKNGNALKSVANVSGNVSGTESFADHANTSNTKQTSTTPNNSKEAEVDTDKRRENGKSAGINNSQDSTAKLNRRTALSPSGTPGKIQSASNSRFAGSVANNSSHSLKGNRLSLNANGGLSNSTRTDNGSSANYRNTHDKLNKLSGDKIASALNGGKKTNGGLLLSSTYLSRLSIDSRDKSSGDNYNDKQNASNQEKKAGTSAGQSANGKNSIDNGRSGYPDLVALNHGFDLTQDNVKIIVGRPLSNRNILQVIKAGNLHNAGNSKAKTVNKTSSSLNWGILIGANSSGSFTPKSQNSNFYGSLPVDLFFGPFVTYNFNSKWAVSSQLRLLNPQIIVTTYTHANASKVDSGQLLTVTASRKMYSVSIPIYAVYKVTSNIGIKLGPVINIPTKQINASSTLQPYSIRTDTTYYTKLRGELDSTNYQQKLNYGLSGGVSIRVKRFIFEATYLRNLSGYKVSSGLGTYKSNNGTFQFSVGFQFK